MSTERVSVVVCAPQGFAQKCANELHSSLSALEVNARIEVVSQDEAITAPEDCPIYDFALLWRPQRTFFQQVRISSAVFSLGAGVEDLLDLGVPSTTLVVKLQDAGLAEQIADFSLATVIREHRSLRLYQEQQLARQWVRHRALPKSAFRVGVLGLGSIGTRIAQELAAAGYCTSGFGRTAHRIDGVTCHAGVASAQTAGDSESEFVGFLRDLDVLICALPATALSRSVLGASVFARLKPSTYIVNVGRGSHLDEEALLTFLRKGELGGAALDVFREEPLPATHPFWSESKISLTPHIAGSPILHEAMNQIAEKIDALLSGQAIGGVVSLEHGY